MIFKRSHSLTNHIARHFGGMMVTIALLVMSVSGWAADGSGAAGTGKIPFPKPRSHTANWLEYHGRAVEPLVNSEGSLSNNCLVCHEKTDCIACHNTRMPRDHTNTWRTLSHGFMAEGNRERCMTCHKQDFCVRCHSETAPRSHIGNWISRHCAWCHFGSGLTPAENCVVCHKTAPHTSAPHNVNGQLNCILCHK
jgi:hypothetical protein